MFWMGLWCRHTPHRHTHRGQVTLILIDLWLLYVWISFQPVINVSPLCRRFILAVSGMQGMMGMFRMAYYRTTFTGFAVWLLSTMWEFFVCVDCLDDLLIFANMCCLLPERTALMYPTVHCFIWPSISSETNKWKVMPCHHFIWMLNAKIFLHKTGLNGK